MTVKNHMKMILTIQHTQSVHHTNGMVGSWTDWDLTETGKKQAYSIGRNLRSEFRENAFVIYTSDLKRARQTAEIIAEYFGTAPILKKELRERNLGRACGKSVQWLRENMKNQEKTIDDRLFSDAESRRDVWNRLKPFFDTLLTDEHENILIVSHGDLLSVFHAMFLGLDPQSPALYGFSGLPGGVSQMFIFNEGYRIIKRISDMSFLR